MSNKQTEMALINRMTHKITGAAFPHLRETKYSVIQYLYSNTTLESEVTKNHFQSQPIEETRLPHTSETIQNAKYSSKMLSFPINL